MKQLLAILSCFLAFEPAAQTAPTLSLKLQPGGALAVNWPVEKPYQPAPDLIPSYQVEIANTVDGSWQFSGPVLRGEDFASGIASINFPGFGQNPAAFLRVQTFLDFTGRSFIDRVFTNAILENADFTGANLFRADLTEASLHNASLLAADLRFSNLNFVDASGADFTLARLGNAICSDVNFTGANLRFTEFADTDLSFCNFQDADLRGAIFENVTNFFTRFHGSQIDDLTVMDQSILERWQIVNNQGAGKNFTSRRFTFSDFSDANLTNTILSGADVSGADFQRANLSGANLNLANIRLNDFRGTIISPSTQIASKWRTVIDIMNNPKTNRVHVNLDLTLGFWIDTIFDHADVHQSRFNNGIMFRVNFNTANAQNALFTGIIFDGSDFRNADLRGANFANASLDNVDFTGAITNGAVFTGATFNNTTMPNGTVRNN